MANMFTFLLLAAFAYATAALAHPAFEAQFFKRTTPSTTGVTVTEITTVSGTLTVTIPGCPTGTGTPGHIVTVTVTETVTSTVTAPASSQPPSSPPVITSISTSSSSPPTPTCAPTSAAVVFDEAFSSSGGDHFYTTDPAEMNNALTQLGEVRYELHITISTHPTPVVPTKRLASKFEDFSHLVGYLQALKILKAQRPSEVS
ncbi:hypothetical protein ONZ45_g5349 [Pleurotus djamor]|nr:hypothetical protein ONZ45_g5349 [Pleurotus djamor]